MHQTAQEQFEEDFAEHTGRALEAIKASRLSNDSYSDPCISKAWHWFKRSRELLAKEASFVESLPLCDTVNTRITQEA